MKAQKHSPTSPHCHRGQQCSHHDVSISVNGFKYQLNLPTMPARPNTVTIDANAGLGDAIPRPEKKKEKTNRRNYYQECLIFGIVFNELKASVSHTPFPSSMTYLNRC